MPYFMIRLSVLLLLLPGLASASGTRSLLVIGDSLSAAYGIPAEAGWVALLERRLQKLHRHWVTVNASITGDTTAGGRSRLPRLLELHAPDLVVIELGSNDGLRGFSFDQIHRNLDAMITRSKESGARVLLVGGRLPPNYGKAYAEAFQQMFHQTAKSANVPLVPFLMDGVVLNPALMQDDGYHPNAAAQARLLENVWSELEGLLKDPMEKR